MEKYLVFENSPLFVTKVLVSDRAVIWLDGKIRKLFEGLNEDSPTTEPFVLTFPYMGPLLRRKESRLKRHCCFTKENFTKQIMPFWHLKKGT